MIRISAFSSTRKDAGVHQQFDPGPDLRPAPAAFQVGQPGAEDADNPRREVAAGFGRLGCAGRIPGGQHEVGAQPCRGLPQARRSVPLSGASEESGR